MLHRLGNKTRLLPQLIELFPENITTFIDMFMGSGSVTFAMVDRCKFVIANDKDKDVFNLYTVLKHDKERLKLELETMPIHEELFSYWKGHEEDTPLQKAVRFIMLSNFSFPGNPMGLCFDYSFPKRVTLEKVDSAFSLIRDVKFMSTDFRNVLKKLHKRDILQDSQTFIYADPPYLGTGAKYAGRFTEDDTRDLFSLLTNSGIRFALSEFRCPLVMALAQEHGLHVTSLGERRNLKNRREEILVTNYEPARTQITMFEAES